MNKDDYLKKLEEACKNLENIGNVVEFKKNNPNGLFGIILPVIQYYNFIQTNFKDDEFAIIDSMAMVLGVGENNPSLKGVVESITSKKNIKEESIDKNSSINKNDEHSFDKTSFINKITSIVDEFKSQNSINTNTVDDFQYFLEKCMEELNANKEYLTQSEYEELSQMISIELGKINRFYEYCENNSSGLKM